MVSYEILGCRLPAGFRYRSGNTVNYLQLAGSYQVEKSEQDLSPIQKPFFIFLVCKSVSFIWDGGVDQNRKTRRRGQVFTNTGLRFLCHFMPSIFTYLLDFQAHALQTERTRIEKYNLLQKFRGETVIHRLWFSELCFLSNSRYCMYIFLVLHSEGKN